MATEKLFGNKVTPACKYCEESFPSQDAEHFLCMKRGVVPGDHACKKFRYDPLRRIPARPLQPQKYEEEDFAI